MQYPPDFPQESRSRVVAEMLRAEKDFDNARENLPRIQHGARTRLETELRRYILRQFVVFVDEASKLGCKGIWQGDRVEEEALEFLRRSTVDAIYSKGFDNAGVAFGRNWMDNFGNIETRVRRELERSEEWRQFRNALLRVAEYQEPGTAASSEASQELNRRTMVDDFLAQCNKESAAGSKVVRKQLWLAAGHTRARQFEYWQDRSERATAEDNRNFLRIISMPPGEFLALLKKKGISPSNS